MGKSSPNAVTLREGHVPHSEPVTLGIFPGVYVAGQPVMLEDLGLDPDAAKSLIEKYNLPLELVSTTRRTAADLSVGANRAPSAPPGAVATPEGDEPVEDLYRSAKSPLPPERVPGSGRFGLSPDDESYESRAEEEGPTAHEVTPIPAEVLADVVDHPEQYPGGARASAEETEEHPAGQPDAAGEDE